MEQEACHLWAPGDLASAEQRAWPGEVVRAAWPPGPVTVRASPPPPQALPSLCSDLGPEVNMFAPLSPAPVDDVHAVLTLVFHMGPWVDMKPCLLLTLACLSLLLTWSTSSQPPIPSSPQVARIQEEEPTRATWRIRQPRPKATGSAADPKEPHL